MTLGVGMADGIAAQLEAARPAAERACRRVLGSAQDAEDCASEAIVVALSDLETLGSIRSIEAWLVTVARRRAVDLVRSRTSERNSFERISHWSIASESDHAAEIADRDEARWVADRLPSMLPATTLAVVQHRSRGETVSETARELRLTERAVESHLLRARRRLVGLLATVPAWAAFMTRRTGKVGVATASVTMVAVSLAVIHAQAPGAHHQAAPLHVVAPVTSVTQPDAAAVTRVIGVARPSVVRRSVTAPMAARTALKSREVAKAPTPVATVTVTNEDRGGATGPIAGTMKCIHEFQVNLNHIGC